MFIGAFDRDAVANETIDFFASGHALVEGVQHFEDDAKGRVGASRAAPSARAAPGRRRLRDGPEFEVVALDQDGRARPDWADLVRRRPLVVRRMKPEDAAEHDWPALVARLAPALGNRRPHAIAAVVVRG